MRAVINKMSLKFESHSVNEAFARQAVGAFVAQLDPTMEELGDMSGRFNYEFVCDLGKRIPREYIRDGKVVEQADCFA